MDGLLNIVSSAAALNPNHFVNVLHGFDEHQTFGQRMPNELEATISLITQNLNGQSQKYEGLLLLKSFVSQCQLDVIEQKGALWMSLCTKVCGQKKPAVAVCLAYDIIGDLLERSLHIPELGKSISSTLLSKVIESIAGQSPECHLAALKCLQVCMRLYAGPCGSSRGIIERFLDALIDVDNMLVVRHVGKCYHLLQQIRGGGVHGIKSKDAWALLQLKYIHVLHDAMDAIYSHTSETADGNMPGDSNELKKALEKWPKLNVSAEPMARATALFTRFRNTCEFLRVALSEPFPTSKLIHPQKVLGVIARGLGVTCQTLGRNAITDNITVGALLPQLHVGLFALLDTLILLLGTNLLAETRTICQFITQTLRWTSSGKVSGFRRPFTAIRQAAYRTLALWCKVAKSGSLVETISDDLIKHIIQDVTPYQGEVTLQVLSGSRKYLSKKARQRLHKAQNDASNIAQTHSKVFNPHNTKIIYSDQGNESLCVQALNALVQFVLVAGCFIKPVHQRILQENIVGISLKVVAAQPSATNLYASTECRRSLYAALQALVISPHHLCPPPVQYALRVFSVAQVRDCSALVRDQCADYLRIIEKVLHPQKESFYFPTEANEVVDAFKRSLDRKNVAREESPPTTDEESDIEMEENLNRPKTPPPSVRPSLTQSSEEKTQSSPVSKKSPAQPLACVVRLTDILSEELIPRKSPRLMSPSPATVLVTDNASPVRVQSSPGPAATPRRRSARLSSLSTQEIGEKTIDQLKAPPPRKMLPTIDEKPTPVAMQTDVGNEVTVDNATDDGNKSVDDLVNEMVSAFVDEFVDEDE